MTPLITPVNGLENVKYIVMERLTSFEAQILREDGWQCVYSHKDKDIWMQAL